MKIVCLDGGALNPGDADWTPIEELGQLTVYTETPGNEFAERALGAEVILVNKTPVFGSEIASLKKCRLVGELATGVNNLDLPGLTSAGIKVCNVPAYGPYDVAQHAIALLLELTRHATLHSQSIKAGEWARRGQWCYWLETPLSLAGKTIGIIGFGEIGRITGRIAHALGMKVLAYSPKNRAQTDYPFKWSTQEEIFALSDVISLHCPLTPENERLINEKSISLMKKGTIIINTARGGLVDEQAAANALREGKLGAFGADVLSSEPPDGENLLLAAPHTLLTPHIAWATLRARQRIIDIMAKNIRDFFAGHPQNLVN